MIHCKRLVEWNMVVDEEIHVCQCGRYALVVDLGLFIRQWGELGGGSKWVHIAQKSIWIIKQGSPLLNTRMTAEPYVTIEYQNDC